MVPSTFWVGLLSYIQRYVFVVIPNPVKLTRNMNRHKERLQGLTQSAGSGSSCVVDIVGSLCVFVLNIILANHSHKHYSGSSWPQTSSLSLCLSFAVRDLPESGRAIVWKFEDLDLLPTLPLVFMGASGSL